MSENGKSPIKERIIRLMADILETDPKGIHGADRLREDLGMDSLGSLELLSCISEELRLSLPMEDAMQLETVDDACAFVERYQKEQHARGA